MPSSCPAASQSNLCPRLSTVIRLAAINWTLQPVNFLKSRRSRQFARWTLCELLFAKVLVFILDSIVLHSDALLGNSPLAYYRFVNFINTWNIYETRPHERINEFYCYTESNALGTKLGLDLNVGALLRVLIIAYLSSVFYAVYLVILWVWDLNTCVYEVWYKINFGTYSSTKHSGAGSADPRSRFVKTKAFEKSSLSCILRQFKRHKRYLRWSRGPHVNNWAFYRLLADKRI